MTLASSPPSAPPSAPPLLPPPPPPPSSHTPRAQDSACLKTKRHFNSFATAFLVPPTEVVATLEGHGRVPKLGRAAEETLLKRAMACPLTGVALPNIPAVKLHLARPAYASGLAALTGDADVLPRWPAVGAGRA